MSENQNNTSIVKTHPFVKGMVKDVTDMYAPAEIWRHARNAINTSHDGERGGIGNEQSNELCGTAPFDVIGIARKTKHEWVVFSSNDVDSEIGIYDEFRCTYTTVVNDPCLGFKRDHIITAVTKKNYDTTYSVYFQDNLNYDRVLNLDKVPYKMLLGPDGNPVNTSPDPDCFIPEYTTDLDCDKLKLHPLVQQPCLTLKKGEGTGQLNNGSYQAAIAYSENGIRLTDYSIPTEPQPLWEHGGVAGSLDVSIDNLDPNFEEYELVIIGIVNQQTFVKKIGNYSIRQTRVHIDVLGQDLITIPLSNIPLRSIVYERSEKMFKVNNYLVRTGVTAQPYINYQPLANQIKTNWVSVNYPADYYRKHGRVTGYMRDEVYSFFIRFVYATGARTASYHIPGRPSRADDRTPVSGRDVIDTETQRWQVYDTSTKAPQPSEVTKDGGIVSYRGEMSYWESTEKYPDDQPNVWGDLCGKPIRHHKMPSNEQIHIHISNGTLIEVLGVEFKNISHPVDDNGNFIPDIVGYEILRGSREGNRTIVSKGIFNNMWEYDIPGSSSPARKGLYQNYPFNDLRPDMFLTTDQTTLDPELSGVPAIENAAPVSIYKRNYFSFHSPENSLVKPYVNANYVKIYTEEVGDVSGSFKPCYKHPKHKLITNFGGITAAALGAGIGLMAAIGKSTVTTSTTAGPSVPVAALFGNNTTTESGYASIFGDTAAMIAKRAINITSVLDAASLLSTIALTGLYGAFFAGQGMDTILDIMHKISNWREYAVQYDSHGFYNKYFAVRDSDAPAGVPKCMRRKVERNGARYIGTVLQDFDANYKINNINREKFLAVKLMQNISDPTNVDNTRVRIRDTSFGHKKPFHKEVQTTTSAYYGAIKVDYQNQYGQLQSIIQIPTDSCVLPIYPVARKFFTPPIFGGDTYINRYTEKNPYYFFNAWQHGEADGTEFDYRNYLNGPTPRYWADFSKYDTSDLNITVSGSFPWLSIFTPSDKHRLDKPSVGTGTLIVNRGYFYIFCNGVRDFFVESELNIAFRDFGEADTEKYYDPYGEYFTDLNTLFRSDLIKARTYYKYDLSLSASKLYYNFGTWGSVLPSDYDPLTYNDRFTYYQGRAVYSLQQQEGLKRDNWRNFLPLNYKDFSGKITSIKELNATGAIILFENHEPVMFAGVDQLQTDKGVKITVGDGGLFQQNMQAFVNADDELQHGSCISMRSAINTPYGLFYASQQTGKILQYGEGLMDISSGGGMRHWFNEHLPSKILQQFPNYDLYDNPVVGTSVQAVYDARYDLVYFTKRDYQCKDPNMKYEPGFGFYKERVETILVDGDPRYTCPEGYTLVEGDLPGSYVCQRITSTTPGYSTIVTDAAATQNEAWGFLGTAIYDPGYNSNGTGAGYNPASPSTVGYTVIPYSNTFWYQPYSTSPSVYNLNPVNRIAVWNPGTPLGGELGFEYNICIEEEKTYYIALTGDNFATLRIDGVNTIVFEPYQMGLNHGQAPVNADKIQYRRLHIYPVTLTAGNHLIQLVGWNESGTPGMIGAEIYDNTSPEIAAATSYSDLNVIFTTRGKTEFTSRAYVCPDGYTLTLNEDCEGVSCVLVETEEPTVTLPPFEVDVIVKDKYYLTDTRFFDECSWTISYDPLEKYWVSFHDWKPRWMFATSNHFITVPDRSFWRHNVRWDSFTSYYGNQEGWEIDFEVFTPEGVTTVRNIEYYMEMYKYYSPLEKHHVLDENFDRAILYNSEQTSGVLFLNLHGKNSPLQLLQYPIVNTNYIDILYSKEEQKYRFNQFWDITRDRGEFTSTKEPIWLWECNGVDRRLNASNLNYRKLPLQRKKFRHTRNNLVLIKQDSGDRKMILKLVFSKHLYSPR